MAISRFSTVFSLATAAILALASCAGPAPAPAEGSPSPGQEGPSQQSVATPNSPEPAVAESTHAPARQLDQGALEAILASLKNDSGEPLSMISATDMAEGQRMQKLALDGAGITPESCRVFAASNAELPAGSVYAAGSWQDEATATATIVTLMSADPSVLAAKLAESTKNRPDCASFSLTVAGQTVQTTLAQLPVETNADTETAMLISQDLPNNTSLHTAMVEALQGGLVVTVAKLGPAVDEGAAPELGTLVNKVLAAS
ncbi:hypothetical protein [Arthrobacter sp.]|uniref:hypothetical protein n=1 Tax=Arthrobacter sp. TaxID=1667 RepID=UPI0026E0E8FA|nr:hypothetical protein [Arthrobacter sp.]MDO5753043.1 hypothetical protein [Arthrobacter sp.]